MKKSCFVIILILLLSGCITTGDPTFPGEHTVVVNKGDYPAYETGISEKPDLTAKAEPDITELPKKKNYPPEKIEAALADASAFAAQIEAICEKYNAVGFSMAVFANGKVIYTQNYGYADMEAEIKANDDTKYRSASVSKTATAICAMTLVDKGELDLDEPISGIINVYLDDNPDVPNTTRHLMTHTSSIVDTYVYDHEFDSSPVLTLPQMMSQYDIFSGDEPGTRYKYANFGAGLVPAVIESVTGKRFYVYAQENLFDKTGMDAAYLRTLIKDTDNIAQIYLNGELAHEIKTWNRTEELYDKVPIGQQYALGQGEMIISASDLAKIGVILSGDGTVDDVRVLSTESVAEMNNPYIEDTNDAGYETAYGCGLRMSKNVVKGRTITGHPGQALGMVAGLYFDVSDGTGVAVLTNGCDVVYEDNGMYGINDSVVKAVYSKFFS